jgi:phosphatidylglycerol lysyltransferase
MNLESRWRLSLWQLAFIFLSTSWLLAPYLNHVLSYRTGLISQYELPGQPYAWIFRLCDVLGASLLVAVALYYKKRPRKEGGALLLLLIGLGMLADPLLTTTCRFSQGICVEYVSIPFFLHAFETIVTSIGIFALAIYDAQARRRVVSIVFVIFQVLYGLLFVSQLATQNRFNTFSQFFYQFALVIWLAWYVRDFLADKPKGVIVQRARLIKNAVALWAFVNGIFSVLVSLADIRVIGKLKGLYFAGDSAWLAQHGMVIGVVLIYLSRHLLRGERRARHIFLAIAGLETLKYAVITPHPGLLALYFSTFCVLFILKGPFDRGPSALTWRLRFKEIVFLAGSLVLAAVIALSILYSNRHDTEITNRTLDHFFDYTLRTKLVPDSRLESALLAHAVSAFILSAAILIMWILFRPSRTITADTDGAEAKRLLAHYSNSTEDFFKIWPEDKYYFYGLGGFIAYKVAGPVAFVLADPLAPNKSAQQRLLKSFLSYAKEHGWRVAVLPVYKGSKKLYEACDLNLIQIGSSAVIDTGKFLDKTIKDKWWRWKNNKAAREGFDYKVSIPQHTAAFLQQLKQVSDSWLGKDGRQERGFALGYFDESYLQQCPIHYLEDKNGKIVCFANRIPTFKASDTMTVDLIRHLPEAGTAMPYLLGKVIGYGSQEGYKLFDLGFVPFAAAEEATVKVVKTLSAGRFSAKGLEQFKNKFSPNWQPNYLAYEGDLADLALITLNIEGVMSLD